MTVADALMGPGPLTVFGPTDMAFMDVSDVTAGLTADQIRDVLLYHAVAAPTPVLSTDLTDGPVPTVNGADVTIDTAGPTVNDANIIVVDLNTTNGVLHIIDAVLIPPL